MIQLFFFYYLAVASIASAVLTVGLRNPVHCGLALLSLLFHIAGFFILLNAEFIAAVQIIIYAGAILVLYLFVLMLLNLKTEERFLHRRYAFWLFFALLAAGQTFLFLLRSPFAGKPGDVTPDKVTRFGHSQTIGIVLFNDYFLPFEIVGVFLLGAIIGAIVLAKDHPAGAVQAASDQKEASQ
ncbi:MAG: NADH-quinone oxidoreductase subunit J [Nitrospirae bacterium]|nr:NADH-quinone oxidoreductase subunit J [Nitrospirota bacterium]